MSIKLRAVVAGSVLLVLSAGMAMAYPATVTRTVNLRSGPGVGYPIRATMPAGVTVDVRGCRGGWCSLGFRGIRGYASAAFIGGGAGPVAVIGAVLPEYYAYAYEYPPYWRNNYFYYWYGGHWRHVRRDRRWWDAHRTFIRSHHRAYRNRPAIRQRHEVRPQRQGVRHERRAANRAAAVRRAARPAARNVRRQAPHRASRPAVHRRAATHRRAVRHAPRHAAPRATHRAPSHTGRGGQGRRDRR